MTKPGRSPLELSGVELGYGTPGRDEGGHRVSAPLSVQVEPGELICLLGPNGSGKSTLLKTVAGAQKPLSGSVRLKGEEIGSISRRELARRVAVVLTDPIYGWSLTGYELVSLGRLPYLGWSGRLGAEDHRQVEAALRRSNAEELAPRLIGELSDGERQRLLLARALAQDASLLLLDEITAFLDLPHRLEVMRLMSEMVKEGWHSVVLSTHDLELALRTADRIWLLPGDGSLHDGAPEDLALSGALHGAFARFGVRFDPATGHFDWEGKQRGVVQLKGEGAAATWAERALRRCGFAVEDSADSAVATVVARSTEGRHEWMLEWAGSVEKHLTLRTLTRSLLMQGASTPGPPFSGGSG